MHQMGSNMSRRFGNKILDKGLWQVVIFVGITEMVIWNLVSLAGYLKRKRQLVQDASLVGYLLEFLDWSKCWLLQFDESGSRNSLHIIILTCRLAEVNSCENSILSPTPTGPHSMAVYKYSIKSQRNEKSGFELTFVESRMQNITQF